MGKETPQTTTSPDQLDQLIRDLESARKEASDNAELAKLAEEQVCTANEELAKTKAALDSANAELAAVTANNDRLADIIEDLTEQIEKKKTVAELAAEAQAKAKKPVPTESFFVAGQAYRFTCPVFTFEGHRILSAEAIDNEELLGRLVAAGVGVIARVQA